jgi:hypothetical protein
MQTVAVHGAVCCWGRHGLLPFQETDNSSILRSTNHTPILTSFRQFQDPQVTLPNKTGFSSRCSQTFSHREYSGRPKGTVSAKLRLLYEYDVCCAFCFRGGDDFLPFIKYMIPLVYSSLVIPLSLFQTIPSFPRYSTEQNWIILTLFSYLVTPGKHSKS